MCNYQYFTNNVSQVVVYLKLSSGAEPEHSIIIVLFISVVASIKREP